MFFRKKQKGFTIIELLVVVGAVGLLTAGTVLMLGNARLKSRDSRRVAYVKQITDALELYYLHNGIYPTLITAGQDLVLNSTTYLNPTPTNPSPRNDGVCPNQDFVYSVRPDNHAFEIKFCLGGTTSGLNAGINVCTQGGTCNSAQPNSVNGLLAWYRADWLALKDGDSVSTWYDSSGNGNNAAALTVAARPLFKANIINRQPVVRFDGTDDLLTLDNNITTVKTVMIVLRWDNQDKDYAPILGSSTVYDFHGQVESPSETDTVFSTWTNDYLEYGRAWVDGTSTASTAVTKNRSSFKLIEFQTDGNSVQFNNISNDRGWAGRNMHGDVAEIIVYDTNLSTAERQKIQRYIKDKYNLVIAGI